MDTTKITAFWKTKSVASFYEMANAEQKTIQPIIAKQIEGYQPQTLLDFGCGDGFIHQMIDDTIERDLFDINGEELKKDESKVKR